MARSYKAGDLRHAVTLLEPVTQMIANRRTVTWREYPAKAGKADVSGREFFQAQAYHAEDIVTYIIRWRDDVTSSWRLRHGAVTYDIVAINHLGYMKDFMQLRCRDVTGGGN